MDSSLALTSVLDLFRRLPSEATAANVDRILSLRPDLTEDILSSVDQPLRVQADSSGKDYLVSGLSPPLRRLSRWPSVLIQRAPYTPYRYATTTETEIRTGEQRSTMAKKDTTSGAASDGDDG